MRARTAVRRHKGERGLEKLRRSHLLHHWGALKVKAHSPDGDSITWEGRDTYKQLTIYSRGQGQTRLQSCLSSWPFTNGGGYGEEICREGSCIFYSGSQFGFRHLSPAVMRQYFPSVQSFIRVWGPTTLIWTNERLRLGLPPSNLEGENHCCRTIPSKSFPLLSLKCVRLRRMKNLGLPLQKWCALGLLWQHLWVRRLSPLARSIRGPCCLTNNTHPASQGGK